VASVLLGSVPRRKTRRECRLLARSGSQHPGARRPLWGTKRTSGGPGL